MQTDNYGGDTKSTNGGIISRLDASREMCKTGVNPHSHINDDNQNTPKINIIALTTL